MAPIAFVLVPGSFAGPNFYHKVTPILESQGCTVDAVSLVSAGDRSPQPPGTVYDDAKAIHEAAEKLLNRGLDVVIAMNSYGGIPGTEAVKGLSRSERGPGNTAVIALVYIAGVLLTEGMSSDDKLGGNAPADLPEFTGSEDPYMHLDANIIPPLCFSDLPESEHMGYFKTMPPQSRVSFSNKLTNAGYKHIPSTYIVTEADRIIKAEMQHEMIDTANQQLSEDMKIKKVMFADSGHCPMLSRPKELVNVLVNVAGKATEEGAAEQISYSAGSSGRQ